MRLKVLAGLIVTAGIGLFASSAQATFVVSVQNDGNDVTFDGAGSLDVSSLNLLVPNAAGGSSSFNFGLGFIPTFQFGAGNLDFYTILDSFPAPFGPDQLELATSSAGDFVSVGPAGLSGPFVAVPVGYVSGTPLASTMTFANTSISALGLIPGTYEWTWAPTGGAADKVVLTVSDIPEPATLSLLAAGLAGVGFATWRRRKSIQH